MADHPSDPDREPGFAHHSGWDQDFETYDDFDLPTYVGPVSFMKLPWVTDPGRAPKPSGRRRDHRGAVRRRREPPTGARFGPRAIREAQYTSGAIHSLQLDVEPFELLTVVDAGDANIVPPGSAGPRDDLPEGARGRRDGRHPDRPRRRPLDHLAVAPRRSPRSAGRAASASSISTPTPTPPTTTGASSPATARRCAG